MPVLIELDDKLASQLSRQAHARRLSLAEFAKHLLDDALEHLEAAAKESAANRRRLALIRKSVSASLPPDEEAELQQLQEALDRRLEPADNQLLEGLERLKRTLEPLPDAGNP